MGSKAAAEATGLEIPESPEHLLRPHARPTTLSAAMEKRVVQSLNEFELKFGTALITPTLIESIANHEILSTFPEVYAEHP